MPVRSGVTDVFAGCQARIEPFLEEGRRLADRLQTDRYVSLAFESADLDPLAVLQVLESRDCLTFYYEDQTEQLAIAAIDSVMAFESNRRDRFQATRQFSEACFAAISTWNPLDLPYGHPHLFGGFTFFGGDRQRVQTFPSSTIFLPRWQITRHAHGTTIVRNVQLRATTQAVILAQEIVREVEALLRSRPKLRTPNERCDRRDRPSIIMDRRHIECFEAAVADVVGSIARGRLHKAVLSHAVDLTAPQPFDAMRSLDNLRRRYTDCRIFMMGNRWGQRFIGASPERLFAVRQRRLVADALAGSAPRGASDADDRRYAAALRASPKEVREHQVVVAFLLDRLRDLGLVPEPAESIQLLQLSNIQHLWTPIAADLTAEIHPLQLVEQLHPTPAVAGLPRAIADREIRRHEQFDRLLFAGPIGWFDAAGNASFLVGIRSALLDGCRARLYAGAGIVAGSQPQRERAEIELKLRTTIDSLI